MGKVYEDGDCSFSDADSANVPVNIWLTEDEGEDGWWTLSACNYMPRKNHVSPDAYRARSKDRAALAALVAKHVVPLYEAALAKAKAMAEGAGEDLYYWDR